MKNALFFLFLFSQFSILDQSINTPLIQQSIANYSQSEKAYLHNDRAYYTAGSDIYFKTYLLKF